MKQLFCKIFTHTISDAVFDDGKWKFCKVCGEKIERIGDIPENRGHTEYAEDGHPIYSSTPMSWNGQKRMEDTLVRCKFMTNSERYIRMSQATMDSLDYRNGLIDRSLSIIYDREEILDEIVKQRDLELEESGAKIDDEDYVRIVDFWMGLYRRVLK